jgi:hypothetical protein
MGWSFNAKAHSIPLHGYNGDSDIAIDHDRFAKFARENQHVHPSLKNTVRFQQSNGRVASVGTSDSKLAVLAGPA